MEDRNITINETLLEFVSHELVTEALVKLCSIYKYVGFFI